MSDLFIRKNPKPIYFYEKESLRFLGANEAALKLYGYSIDEFQQMDLTDLFTSEDIQTLLESSQEIFKDGEFSKPFKHRKKDGSYIFVRISRIDYVFENTDAYINILDDVSESFENEKKKQIFKAAFDNTNDMIFITDPDGIITYVNESTCKFLGMASADLINTDITLNCGEEDKLFINNSVFHSHIKETVTFTIELITSEGKLLESDVVSTPVFDAYNNVEAFVLIAKSAQGSKAAPKKSQKVEPENLTETKSNQLFNDTSYLTGLFHEILTPMNVILGFTQELIESIENPSPEQLEATQIINQNRISLLNLMNTIIEFYDITINNSQIELSEIPITEVIENYDKNIKEITGIKDLEFAYGKISSSLKIETDRRKLFNLMNNAFRLISGISSSKKLFFSAYPNENNIFFISISDNLGKSSATFIQTMKHLFMEKKEPKLVGVSKLTIEIINNILKALNGQIIIINENSDKETFAFKFPIKFNEPIEEPVADEVKELPNIKEEKTDSVLVEDIGDQVLNVSEEIEIEEEEVLSSLDKESIDLDVIELDKEEKERLEKIIKTPPPTDKVSLEKKSEYNKSKNGLSHLRCLYIEDQADSQILFKVQMKDLKNIQFAASFEEALPLLESNEFDFIIMDINLQGDYNGVDALKIIHQIPRLERIPVIAVTAYVLPGDKEKFIATGFTDFISKPIFREKMLESLKKIFVN